MVVHKLGKGNLVNQTGGCDDDLILEAALTMDRMRQGGLAMSASMYNIQLYFKIFHLKSLSCKAASWEMIYLPHRSLNLEEET